MIHFDGPLWFMEATIAKDRVRYLKLLWYASQIAKESNASR